MRDLSLHMLDLAQNCITAGATLVEMELVQSQDGVLRMVICDNGCGMDEEMAKKAQSPFTTTRTTRKVGLGIPLTKENAELTGGCLTVHSEKGKGTCITAQFLTTSIDCLPLGDVAGTLVSLVAAHPESPDFVLFCRTTLGEMRFDTREVKGVLQGVSLNEPEVVLWMNQSLQEEIQPLFGGSLQ